MYVYKFTSGLAAMRQASRKLKVLCFPLSIIHSASREAASQVSETPFRNIMQLWNAAPEENSQMYLKQNAQHRKQNLSHSLI